MYIEILSVEKQLHLTPQTKEEETLLRNSNIVNDLGYLIWWGDTEPYGSMNQGLKIAWDGTKDK